MADLARPLGVPLVSVPADNPMSPEKIALGTTLFNVKHFGSTGEVSCSTCHDPYQAFTDSPLTTSEGIATLTGTRNAPTVMNAAPNAKQFWDGRSPDLEDQSRRPCIKPVEMEPKDHEPVSKILCSDPARIDM
jgi:cytochrome c peroxidase